MESHPDNTSGKLKNMDGQVYYDPENGGFDRGFNTAQKELLERAIREGKPIGLIAYPCISPERMEILISYMKAGLDGPDRGGVTALDLYKCGQLDISPEKTRLILEIISTLWHIKPIDECDDVTALDEECLSLILEAAREGKDLCRDANRLTPEQFKSYASKTVGRMRRINNLSDAVDKIRFKEHFDIVLGSSEEI